MCSAVYIEFQHFYVFEPGCIKNNMEGIYAFYMFSILCMLFKYFCVYACVSIKTHQISS